MPEIVITTLIDAPIQRCFDLARSIDFHQFTSTRTNEEAIGGRTKGLINNGETVTWRARHFWGGANPDLGNPCNGSALHV